MTRQGKRSFERKLRKVRDRRKCGPCSACCDVFAVQITPEYRKPPCVACHHLAPAGGCSIYESRPKECETFSCLWRLGFFDEEMRPDIANAIFVLDYVHPTEGWSVFRMRQVREGGMTPMARQLLESMQAKGHVVIVETRQEMAARKDMPDNAQVAVHMFCKPDHPVHKIGRLPNARWDKEGEMK